MTNLEALAAARSLVDEFGVYMAEYLQRVRESKGNDTIDASDIRASVGYAFSMREGRGAEDALQVGVVSQVNAPIDLDQEMIAESRRLAALGKVRPMREFLDERRPNAQH